MTIHVQVRFHQLYRFWLNKYFIHYLNSSVVSEKNKF
jgi:hypothetical protein